MRRRFVHRGSKDLISDRRTFLERRIDLMMLTLTIGRTRPQWAGPRTPDVMARIIKETGPYRAPWEMSLEDLP